LNAQEERIGLKEEKYSTISANENTSVSKMYRKLLCARNGE
jgi:hypothetical protein